MGGVSPGAISCPALPRTWHKRVDRPGGRQAAGPFRVEDVLRGEGDGHRCSAGAALIARDPPDQHDPAAGLHSSMWPSSSAAQLAPNCVLDKPVSLTLQLGSLKESRPMKLEDLDTPALVVDLDCMQKNLERVASYCRQHNLSLRPHTKTHKTPWLARKQVELGAGGITVAKLGEAEVMSAAGLDDLLIAYPLVGEQKARRLRDVLDRARVTVSLDSEEAADWVSRAADGSSIDVLVEIDFGMRRCGLPPGEAPLRLAQAIEGKPGLRFKGVMLYSGHVHPDREGSTRRLERLNADLNRQLELFRREAIAVEVVSGGSTPALFYSHQVEGFTEIRPGTYIFNDRNTVEWGACLPEQCAAFVLATVVSTAVSGQAIIDGGSKTFSSDGLAPGDRGGYGTVLGFPGVEFTRMNEEHGFLKLPEGVDLEVGRQLRVLPNHICTTVNMHDRIWGIQGDEVVKDWEVSARGRIR